MPSQIVVVGLLAGSVLIFSTCQARGANSQIGPWTIEHYNSEEIAIVMARCAAVQYVNGAALAVAPNPEQIDDRRTVHMSFRDTRRLTVRHSVRHSRVNFMVDGGSGFGAVFNEFEPQSGKYAGVYRLVDLQGRALFVVSRVGDVEIGRFTFSLARTADALAELRRKGCALDFGPESAPKDFDRLFNAVRLGQTKDEVQAKLGVANNTTSYDDKSFDLAWTFKGRKPYTVEFNTGGLVTGKNRSSLH